MKLSLYLSSADKLQRYLPFISYLEGKILDVGGGIAETTFEGFNATNRKYIYQNLN